jgi:transcriptional regulator with XRE-family HTH domain
MNTYIVKALKEGRLRKGYKQADVTRLIGIKVSTLSNYENAVTEPDVDSFLALCNLYGLDFEEIMSEAYGYKTVGKDFHIKKSEIELIERYRALDAFGQESVNMVLNHESERVNVGKKEEQEKTAI